ncbi:uncharacterized protein VTP21DRAFT_7996 [Calcarisporiella thermophila]|uniref:uncharacterized protein n=1 Tax=Calcarisporiella thermophila TaxID=911321 RepID=UPI0037432428
MGGQDDKVPGSPSAGLLTRVLCPLARQSLRPTATTAGSPNTGAGNRVANSIGMDLRKKVRNSPLFRKAALACTTLGFRDGVKQTRPFFPSAPSPAHCRRPPYSESYLGTHAAADQTRASPCISRPSSWAKAAGDEDRRGQGLAPPSAGEVPVAGFNSRGGVQISKLEFP